MKNKFTNKPQLRSAIAATGGAIYCSGAVSLNDDIISSNSVAGTANGTNFQIGGEGAGGGIYAAEVLNVESTTISGNSADGGSAFIQGDGGDADECRGEGRS